MADSGTVHEGLSTDEQVAGQSPVALTFVNALPFFLPLAIFPFIAVAAMYGGWWLAGPFAFLFLMDQFDTVLGTDTKNYDPKLPAHQLLWFKLAVWVWVACYPVVFLFAFRQVFAADYLAIWECVLIVLSLGSLARLTLNAGHDMMHRRTVLERRIGEVLMASVTFPQEITEHLYVHHAHIGTPKDSVSAPKGQSFWQYLPRSVFRSYLDTWLVERHRMARRGLSVWHYTNPVWRYMLETAAWYGLAYWIGGVVAVLVFMAISAMGIFQLRMVDYMQHYGLQRVRLPSGRYERVKPRHSWSIAYRLSNWMYYNAQRHAQHHIHASTLYPLVKHSGPDEAPQLPGSYSSMGNLVLSPRRWFEKIDPLVDQWRENFYPEIDNWSAYDSAAYYARPDAFEVISEILNCAPRLAGWMNRNPRVLDGLNSREFTDLELRGEFGPDREFERTVRQGLARVYWTYELDVAELQARIAEFPARSAQDSLEMVRDWTNDKVFQICIHVIRGSLSPAEASIAISNIAEASLDAVLAAVNEDLVQPHSTDGIVAAVVGNLAGRDALFRIDLDIMLAFEGQAGKYQDALFNGCVETLQKFTKDNLLFAKLDENRPKAAHALADLPNSIATTDSSAQVLDLIRTRRVFANGAPGIGERFDKVRIDLLSDDLVRERAISDIGELLKGSGSAQPAPGMIDDARGGFTDVERAARILQLTHAPELPEILTPDMVEVFRSAGNHDLIPADLAQRLVTAATLWRNMRGILQLVADDKWSIETASPASTMTIARACGCDDFAALTVTIQETAEIAAACIDDLTK